MNLLNQLTIKNLKLNKKRTIVTIVGIMLSVALITAVASVYMSGVASLIEFETYEKGDFHYCFYRVPASEIETFKNNRSIKDCYITNGLGYAKIESMNEYKPYAYVSAFTMGALKNLSVKLVEGRLPENQNEIIIPTHLYTNGGVKLNVGDTITLEVGTRVADDGEAYGKENPENEIYELGQDNPFDPDREKLINTKGKTYTIVGIIERPAWTIEAYEAPGYTFITCMDEKDMTGNVDIYAKYTKAGLKKRYSVTAGILGIDQEKFAKIYSGSGFTDEAEMNEAYRELSKAKYECDVNEYLITLETNPLGDNSISGLGVVALIVCGIIVATSVFCIKNSFDISISEKIRQYGMLASIGATKKQIKRNVFYEAFILGIIGIPLGIGSGFLASYILMMISDYYLSDVFMENLKLKFQFSWQATIFSCIIGIITIYLSSARSARKASKVSPITAIRNSSEIKIQSRKLKIPKIIGKIFGIGGQISYKNLKRNKKKYRTTTISIAMSVAVFIALSYFMNMTYREIKSTYTTYEYNLSLNLDLSVKYGDQSIYDDISAVTGIDYIEKYSIQDMALADISDGVLRYTKEYSQCIKIYEEYFGDSIREDEEDNRDVPVVIYSVGDAEYKSYIRELGLKYEDVKDKLIIINDEGVYDYLGDTEKTVEVFDYEKGDKVTLKFDKMIYSELNENKENVSEDNTLNITSEVACVTTKRPFGSGNDQSFNIVVSDEYFEALKSYNGIGIQTYNNITLYFKTDHANRLQEDIEEILKKDSWENGVHFYNVDEEVQQMNSFYTLVAIFLYGFIIVISLIGITNIFNTITTGMELRKQEFAMLKSIGMTKHEFNRMIRLESIFMGTKSLLYGSIIGLALSYVMHERMASFAYALPVKAILISVIAVFLLITCIMKYSISKINKQNTIETIRNENI